MRFLPWAYRKSIHDINYKKLKEMGIKCLAFDLDNTLTTVEKNEFSKKDLKLIEELKKDFIVVIISNNPSKKRVGYYAEKIDVEYVRFALKPLTLGLRKICKRYGLEKSEIVMIGDQFLTDVFSAYRFKVKSILVDPIAPKEEKITKFNRKIEKAIEKRYKKLDVWIRGHYYE